MSQRSDRVIYINEPPLNFNTARDDALEQVTSIIYSPVQPVDSLVYDVHGRLQSHKDTTGKQRAFSYDAEGHPTQIVGSGTENLAYGPSGSLARRTLPDSTVQYYVGGVLTINNGTTGAAHVLLGGSRVATVSGVNILYYHRDRLGSIVGTSTNGGVAGAKYRYDVYGLADKPSGETITNASELGYTGALRLSEGLVYLNARVYDPKTRRFLQPDNVDSRRYAYAGGDPVDSIDPGGHFGVQINFERYHIGVAQIDWGYGALAGAAGYGWIGGGTGVVSVVNGPTTDASVSQPSAAGSSTASNLDASASPEASITSIMSFSAQFSSQTAASNDGPGTLMSVTGISGISAGVLAASTVVGAVGIGLVLGPAVGALAAAGGILGGAVSGYLGYKAGLRGGALLGNIGAGVLTGVLSTVVPPLFGPQVIAGALGGSAGNAIGQFISGDSFNGGSVVVSAGAGGLAGGFGALAGGGFSVMGTDGYITATATGLISGPLQGVFDYAGQSLFYPATPHDPSTWRY